MRSPKKGSVSFAKSKAFPHPKAPISTSVSILIPNGCTSSLGFACNRCSHMMSYLEAMPPTESSTPRLTAVASRFCCSADLKSILDLVRGRALSPDGSGGTIDPGTYAGLHRATRFQIFDGHPAILAAVE